MNRVFYTYETSYGIITIESDGKAITSVKIGAHNFTDVKKEADKLTDLAAVQLCEYFDGKRKKFDVPLNPIGTPFQELVWKALLKIPYGETRSYKDIADAIGKPKACRAVGMANNKNPIWIIIPCHRAIGADGSLTGYGGGIEMKRRLLELEQTT